MLLLPKSMLESVDMAGVGLVNMITLSHLRYSSKHQPDDWRDWPISVLDSPSWEKTSIQWLASNKVAHIPYLKLCDRTKHRPYRFIIQSASTYIIIPALYMHSHSGDSIKTEAWILRRLVSVFAQAARRPHVPRDAGLRKLFQTVGIDFNSYQPGILDKKYGSQHPLPYCTCVSRPLTYLCW